MNINPTTLNAFRNDFQNAVKQLEEQYGVHIDLGRITYEQNEFRCKLTVHNGSAQQQLTKDDFAIGQKVTINHKKADPTTVYRIVKINNKNIQVVNVDRASEKINCHPSFLVPYVKA